MPDARAPRVGIPSHFHNELIFRCLPLPLYLPPTARSRFDRAIEISRARFKAHEIAAKLSSKTNEAWLISVAIDAVYCKLRLSQSLAPCRRHRAKSASAV